MEKATLVSGVGRIGPDRKERGSALLVSLDSRAGLALSCHRPTDLSPSGNNVVQCCHFRDILYFIISRGGISSVQATQYDPFVHYLVH